MNAQQVVGLLDESPIVAAVKNEEGLQRCLTCESKVVFVLFGTVNSVPDLVNALKNAGKTVFVHLDLLEGLSAQEAAVDYLARNTRADGVISTKAPLIRYAKSLGLVTVQRVFVLDSMALESLRRAGAQPYADFLELLPGLMTKIIRRLCAQIDKPIIAGGLISDKEDVQNALGAGAVAISSTNQDVWFM